MEARSARTEFNRPEEVLDGSTCSGGSSDTVLEASIGSAEDGVVGSVSSRRLDVGQNRNENGYVYKSAHCPNQGKTAGEPENELDQVAADFPRVLRLWDGGAQPQPKSNA